MRPMIHLFKITVCSDFVDRVIHHRQNPLESTDSSIVACVFIAAVKFLPSRCLATIRGYIQTSTLMECSYEVRR
jgi:hypothetical protein